MTAQILVDQEVVIPQVKNPTNGINEPKSLKACFCFCCLLRKTKSY
ncbi:hypothetical protein V6Z11_D04G074300 [Gossypium hirsutum]